MRKLHLGLDLVSGEIVCSDLTTDDIGEPTVMALTDRFGPLIEDTIPPPKNAVLSPTPHGTRAFGTAILPT
jgi:hypothetical protein